jgi:hypothetical protein
MRFRDAIAPGWSKSRHARATAVARSVAKPREPAARRLARALHTSRRMTTQRASLIFLLSAGCAPAVRFADRPILWRDPDDAPIRIPRPRATGIQYSGFRDGVLYPVDRALSLDYGVEADNANALDEAPDSSWFVDLRRGSDESARPRAISDQEMARGAFGEDPGPVAPFTVVKGKTIGSTPGLVVKDARGRRYMFKLDPPGWLGLNTSTEVVATRLVWAAGWLVPAEQIIAVDPAQLLLAPEAKSKDAWDQEVPFGSEQLEALLARTPREDDGRLRVCASAWLPGRNIGSWAYMGLRKDDPNDRVPHQNRRDVRGFGVMAAWLNDIDTMENNTMDAYVGEDGAGHVVHFQQDVGGSFGQFAAVPAEQWMGEETFFMPGRILSSLFTFGALSRRWDTPQRDAERRRLLAAYPQLGYFDDASFDARDWHPVLDNPAFERQTARDRFWGAKRVLAFSPPGDPRGGRARPLSPRGRRPAVPDPHEPAGEDRPRLPGRGGAARLLPRRGADAVLRRPVDRRRAGRERALLHRRERAPGRCRGGALRAAARR